MARKLAAAVMVLVVAGLCVFLYYYTKSPNRIDITDNSSSKGMFGYNFFDVDESGELAVRAAGLFDVNGTLVYSAAKREQSASQAPSSVTVITSRLRSV